MPDRRTLRIFEATAVLLFFLQALRVLFSSLFGVIYDAVFAETLGAGRLGVVVACVLAAFVAPLFVPRRRDRMGLLVAPLTAASARVALTFNQPDLRLWSALLLTAAGGGYSVMLLQRRPRTFATALTAAFIADQFLRAAGNTYDVALRPWWIPVQVVVSLAVGAATWLLYVRFQPEDRPNGDGGINIPKGISLGALLFLEASLLGVPNALARWTGADYALVAPLLMAATLLPVLDSAYWGGFALFALTLLTGWLTGHQFYQLAILAPMVLAQLAFISSVWRLLELSAGGRTRLSFVLGMAFFLLLNVALAFAFTYPYTIPFFRDKGDYIFLLAFVILLLPAVGPRSSTPRASNRQPGMIIWGASALLVFLTAVFALPPRMKIHVAEPDSFRVGTYNIHYGYDSDWRFTLEQQARAIEDSGADIMMLQEVDAGRITSYVVDDALWLARRLDMQVVFGPALEDLSGIAVLSRFPISETNSLELSSELEQTAIVHAVLRLSQLAAGAEDATGTQPILHAYGTWLGLEPEERGRQLEEALEVIGDTSPAVLGGDFNATPGSPTYRSLRAAGFEDAFTTPELDAPATSPAINPVERIDYVWTRGLDVRDAQVLSALASDHRAVIVELALP